MVPFPVEAAIFHFPPGPLEHGKGLRELGLEISNSSCAMFSQYLDAAILWHSIYLTFKSRNPLFFYLHLVQPFSHLCPVSLYSNLPRGGGGGLYPWQLDIAALQKELDKSQSVFCGNPSVWLKDLASYLNYKLQAPLSEPTLSQHTHG